MDRLTLTEVGELVFDIYRDLGLAMKLRKAFPPFPWEMAFYDQGLEVSQMTGHFIGPSTFRSIFRLRYLEETPGSELALLMNRKLKRGLLHSEYWNDDTWNRFSVRTGLSRMEVVRSNERSLDLS